jgi:hypothetical protein
MSAIIPPMRVTLVVRRAPVHISWRLYTRSRSWNAHRNGVKAPRSIDVVPSHTMCEMMRLSSQAMTRSTLQRGVISIPINCSAASAKPTLFAMGDR